MAESGLTLTASNYQVAIARVLGISTDSSDWSSVESAQITRVLNDGYTEFLMAHDWEFLKVPATATLTSGVATFSMPDNFSGYLLEPFTYAVNAGGPITGVQYVTDEYIRQVKSGGTVSGPPTHFSLRVLSASPPVDPTTVSTRWQANFYPTPDAAYVLAYRFQVLPSTFTSTSYPYGGALHSRTIQAFMCAAAKMEADGEIGEWEAKKQQLLENSKRIDRQTMPVYRGMVNDGRRSAAGYITINDATYLGVTY